MNPSDFARFFQAQYASFQEDLPFWLKLAAQHRPFLLELGCGPGRLLRPLLRLGCQVVAVDLDQEMIQRARRSVPEDLLPQLLLLRSDIRKLGLTTRFNLAIMACNTFSAIDPQQAAEILGRICDSLSQGGVLALELPNFNPATWELADEDSLIDSFLEPESGNAVQVYCLQQLKMSSTWVRVIWRFDELDQEGHVQSHRLESDFFLWAEEILRIELKRAGFSRVDLYGDYSMAPFREDSPRMLVCATKQDPHPTVSDLAHRSRAQQ